MRAGEFQYALRLSERREKGELRRVKSGANLSGDRPMGQSPESRLTQSHAAKRLTITCLDPV